MCGIAGIIEHNPSSISRERLRAMTDVIAHRGPDGEGQWIAPSGNVALGHRRLSIIDLSHEADQPMHYLDRYTLVFNGEIYNYIELRETLIQQGYRFHTKSDTEVLMALYDRHGEQCLQLLDGMFAFALYDRQEQTLFCARDRFGEKPFFYHYEKGKSFVFGSEMKCLWAAGLPKEQNGRMLFNYLSFGYIENPQDLSETFYTHCTRLPHSHFIRLHVPTMELQRKQYYDINWQYTDTAITPQQAQDRLHELFYTSVQRRLRSDVAVGSSLSGGLDSSLVVCVIDALKKGSGQKQNTFSAVFPGYKKDERRFMDFVIAKTDVHPHFVTPNDEGLARDLEALCLHQEEPFVSASIYAQFCVMQLAKIKNTTVLLDGQGADEMLAGYHHFYLPFFREIKGSPGYQAQLAAYHELHLGNPLNGIARKSAGDWVRSLSPALIRPVKRARNAWKQATSPYLHPDFYHAHKHEVFQTPGNAFETLNEALYSSLFQYGMQQLLRYADRNSMAHSREVRLPFLYHELVEFLFSLPATCKINKGWTKAIMRDTFSILPEEIRWRRDKIGYEPPQKNWMEQDTIQAVMQKSRQKLVDRHYLHPQQLSRKAMAVNASEMSNNSWQQFMAGSIL